MLWKAMDVGKNVVGTTFNSFIIIFCWCFNLLSSYRVTLARVFFISSMMLYPISSETISVFYGGVCSDWTGLNSVALGDAFFVATLSFITGLAPFCFWVVWGGSSWFLLRVLTGNAS